MTAATATGIQNKYGLETMSDELAEISLPKETSVAVKPIPK